MSARRVLLVAAVLLAVAPPTAGAADPDLGAEWHLDSAAPAGDAAVTPDASGNGNDGQLRYGAALTPGGRFGNGLVSSDPLSARAGAYAPSSASLSPARLTVLAWVRRQGTAPGVHYLVSKGGLDCSASSWSLSTTAVGALRFYVTVDTAGGRVTYVAPAAPTSLWDGDWHAVAGTFDGATVRLYVDGREVGTGTPAPGELSYVIPTNPQLSQTSTTGVALGTFPNSANCAIDYHWPGGLDEVRVYRRALTKTEIAYLARGDFVFPPELPVPVTPPPPAGTPPAAIVGPKIVSEPGRDGTYRCRPGTWTGAPAFTFTWLRRDGGRDTEVSHGTTYSPGATAVSAALHAGSSYRCFVEARNAFGTGGALSPAVLLAPRIRDPLLLRDPYGDVRIRGIDVIEEVQPNTGAQQFLFPSGAFAALPGGGTPTGLTFGSSGLVGDRQRATYQGVLLDRTKPATAVVYVDAKDRPVTDRRQPLEVSLSLVSSGRVVRGPIIREVRNPLRSRTDVVLNTERAGSGFGVRIPIPEAWLLRGRLSDGGTITLRAAVRFPRVALGVFGLRECAALGCAANDTYQLDGIRLGPLIRGLTIQALDLRVTGQSPPPSPTSVLRGAREVMPGGERLQVLPYAGQLDITFASNAVPGPKLCKGVTTRACREAIVGAQIAFWADNNPATQRVGWLRLPFHVYDLLMGVHNYQGTPGSVEPGWSSPQGIETLPILGEDFTAFGLQPYMALTSTGRPLTAAAHELGHQLTAPHADQTCGGNSNGQIGEPWAPDNAGRLQGALAVIRPALAGSPSSLRSLSVDGARGTRLFDLMSYCAPKNPETGVGLSARNWDRFFSAQLAYQDRVREAGFARVSARRAPSPRALLAVGIVGAGGGSITRIGRSRAVPAEVPSSPLRLRSLAADGRVLRDAGVAARPLSEQAELTTFSGPVAPAARAVELVRGGRVLGRRTRSRAPRVRLLAPRAERRVRRGRALSVRWRAWDPDSRALDAKVEFSPDGGRSWRTVRDGPSRGSARVSSSVLAGSRNARVRLTVGDGFAERSVVSGRLRVDARPPVVSIQRPVRGEVLDAGAHVLLGAARDDLGRALRGRSLTWFTGRRRLGHGERLRVGRLASGRTTVRLAARAGGGATTTARTRVRVAAAPPRLLELRATRVVALRARTIDVRVRAAGPAVLRAGGRRFRVGPRARRLRLALPRTPRRGLLRIPVVLAGPGGRVAGAIEVVRT